MRTHGIRETHQIEPGAMGNDQPMTSMKEEWHPQELGINLLSIRSGPMVGKQTFTIVELSTSEPRPAAISIGPLDTKSVTSVSIRRSPGKREELLPSALLILPRPQASQ